MPYWNGKEYPYTPEGMQQMQADQQAAQGGGLAPGPMTGGPPLSAQPQGMMANPPQQMGPPSELATPPQPPSPPISDADLDSIAGMGGQELELDAMGSQLARAQALRDTALPGMRGEGGRVQTAANPLEFIGAGIKQYRGAKDAQRLEGEMKDVRGKLGESSKTYHKQAYKEKGVGGLISSVADKIKKKRPEDED